MSNISLAIGGRRFTVACAPGEEQHVTELGQMIDTKIASLGDPAGQSESRMLLFAALLLADEVHDAGLRQPAVEADGFGDRLLAIAERLENLAGRLEQDPGTA